MTAERKSTMISARVARSVVDRVDFVARNTIDETLKNRSQCVQQALEGWLPAQEASLVALGIQPPKKAR